jgi:hypothetical protein
MVKEIVGTELGLTNNSLVHNRKTSSEMVGFFYVHSYYTFYHAHANILFGNCQSNYSDLRREGRITYANQIYSGDHGGDIL